MILFLYWNQKLQFIRFRLATTRFEIYWQNSNLKASFEFNNHLPWAQNVCNVIGRVPGWVDTSPQLQLNKSSTTLNPVHLIFRL